jgi:hypothetical protein
MIAEESIVRSISVLGFRLREQMHAKEREGAPSRLAETDQQFQVQVSGSAGSTTIWTKVKVIFDETIYVAPAQRQNPLGEPHFTFGSTMQSATPVILHATVQDWITDTSGNYTGAEVNIGVDGRDSQPKPYKATVHLLFQGFSAPTYPATGTGEG